jgi:hypothetical protein
MKRVSGRYFILVLLTAVAAGCDSSVSTPTPTTPTNESESPVSISPPVAPTLGAENASDSPLPPDCEGENYYCQNMETENPAIHEFCAGQSGSAPMLVVDPETGNQCMCHCGKVNG